MFLDKACNIRLFQQPLLKWFDQKKKAADQPFTNLFKVKTVLLDIYLDLYFYVPSNIAHTGYLNPFYRETGRKEDLNSRVQGVKKP